MKKLLYLVMPVSLWAASCQSSSQKNNTTIEKIPVAISTVQSRSAHALQLSGKVESSNAATISTRVMGYVEAVLVEVGDNVKKGQLLVRINSADLTAKQAQADAMIAESSAALKSAKKDLDRFERLHQQKSATDKEYEQMQLQYESVKAKNEAALQMRNEVLAMQQYTALKAPFDGQITQKIAHAGDLANPGMPLLMMEQQGELLVVMLVPEQNRMFVKEGTKATVTITSIHQSFETVIGHISMSAAHSGGQYLAKLAIPEAIAKQMLPGMYATIDIQDGGTAQAGLFVPVQSIVRKDQLTGVYVYSNGKAYLRWLKTGAEGNGYMEVLTGLKASDTIILSSEKTIMNGSAVRIK